MNERIQELAAQAGAIPIHGEPKNRALVGYDNINKFAELLIKECIEISQVGSITESKLKEHFGVE